MGAVRLAQQKYAEAETLLRESSPLLEKHWPDAAYRFHVMSLLGASLSGQQKYAEAEPLLLQGFQGLQQRQPAFPPISAPRAGSESPSNGWCNSTTPGASRRKRPSGDRNWSSSTKPEKPRTAEPSLERRTHKAPMKDNSRRYPVCVIGITRKPRAGIHESQRDSVPKPRVARHELPWERRPTSVSTPTGLRPVRAVLVPQPRWG